MFGYFQFFLILILASSIDGQQESFLAKDDSNSGNHSMTLSPRKELTFTKFRPTTAIPLQMTTLSPRLKFNKDRCPAEPIGNVSSTSLYWMESRPGIATTNIPCLQPNGLPLTRKCLWSVELRFAYWERITVNITECITRTREKLVTDALARLQDDTFVTNKTTPAEAARRLKMIFKKDDFKLIPADVYFITSFLLKMAEIEKTPAIRLDILSVYNRLMGADKDVLRTATRFYNATNNLVTCFETCVDAASRDTTPAAVSVEDRIDGVNLKKFGVGAQLGENLSFFFIDPEVANVTGIALYDQPRNPQAFGMFREKFGNFYYRFLFSNETVENLLEEKGLEIATYFPYPLWKNLTKHLTPSGIFVVKIWSNDALFAEARLNTTRKVFSKIASLSIPGVTGSFEGLLPMIFHNHHAGLSQEHPETGCGYWNYDTWMSDGIELLNISAKNNLVACGSHHMTQFAYLIGGDYRYNDFSDNVVITKVHLRALNVITLVGCTLSILGLLGIFITSVVFQSWRSKVSSKVLLHFCSAIMFQMVIFCFVNTHDMTMYLMENKDYAGCVAVGALLQYSVLVQFTWMLVIAFFQFQRYVQVLGSRPKHFVLKSAIVGWGVPILPPAILIAVDRKSFIPFYNKDSSMLCYPTGNGLNFGVILPISLIIVANLVIFFMVIWNIRHMMEVASKKSEKKLVLQQIRLMVMLFFLFGFSWIFGLLAAMDAGLAFSYLFCITATLQGFVLFVYFVILDPATRKLWYQICWNAEDKVKESEASLGTSV